MRTLAVLLVVVAGTPPARASEADDTRKAKAYLREVKKHLLESFVDRERMKDQALVAAAVKGMKAALDHGDFAGLDADVRAAVKEALADRESIEEALDAAHERCAEIDFIKLADHGARGMLKEAGDPFSRILTQQDMMKLFKIMQEGGREATAGCVVQVKDGKGSVYYVQYGTPAYEEGLQIGDEVLEIRAKKPSTLTPDRIDELLKLPVGESMELKVRRYGKEYAFTLTQRKGDAEGAVRYRYLGQGIGYLRVTLFDLNLVREVRNALSELSREGMKGLIFDLRHNPGGALPAATGVADLFLKQGLVIAKTVSHYKPAIAGIRLPWLAIEPEYKTKSRSDFEEVPMVCLIDGASASASELLAGALKDHGRAVLIGETTYGKGVGQSPIMLSSMPLQRYLYLTVMRYTTPTGTEVDKKGVAPDVQFRQERPPAERFDALFELRRSGRLEQYVDGHWAAELKRRAEYDAFETSRYPGFDAFYAGLKTSLGKDEVRGEIRRAIRRKMAEEGTVWVSDLQTDVVLQRGLVQLLDKLEKE